MNKTLGFTMILAAACGGSTGGPMMDGHVDAATPHQDGGAATDGPVVRGPDMAHPPGTDMAVIHNDAATGGTTTVFTIVLENHDYNEIVGSADAPYINQLIGQYGLATNYMDSGTHPSLPNYLDMISGDKQYIGVVDCDPKAFCLTLFGNFPVDKDNLGHQLTVANIPWRSYQEDMGTACNLTGSGNYAPKHDPFLYFTNIQNDAGGLCAQTNVDYSNFATDLAGGQYRYMWITPNLINDGHDPSNDPVTALKQSDDWCKTEIPKILASNAYKHGGIIFLTWDEAAGRNGSKDQVPMIIITEQIKSAGYKSNVAYSHDSYLATVEDLFGLPYLGKAAMAASMKEFWQ